MFLEIRSSEIASEAILEQKQSRSSYMAQRVLHPIFSCPYMQWLSQLTSNWHERKYYVCQNSRWGDRWWNSMQKTLTIRQMSIKLIREPYFSMHADGRSWCKWRNSRKIPCVTWESITSFATRVFSRDVVLGRGGGGIAFVGRENVTNIQKTNEICYCMGGGNSKLRGGISPLRALKKHCLQLGLLMG